MGKRLLSLLAALGVLSCVLLAAAQIVLYMRTDDVYLEETVLLGDPAAAQGLEVDVLYDCGQHLRWASRTPVGDIEAQESKFSFSPATLDRSLYWSGVDGVDIEFSGGTYYIRQGLLKDPEEYDRDNAEFPDEMYDLLREFAEQVTEYGTPYEVTIDLKDYFDYLPLSISPWGVKFLDRDTTLLRNYFRIPVPPGTMLDLSIQMWSDSYYDITFHFADGGPSIDSRSVVLDTDEAGVASDIAFALPVSDDGVPLDDSLIPGGWGVYRLSANQDRDGVFHPTLTTAYSLPEDETILNFWSAEDKSALFLLTRRAGDHMLLLRVLDWKTVTPTQTLELFPHDPDHVQQPLDPRDDPAPLYLSGEPYCGEDFVVISTQYWRMFGDTERYAQPEEEYDFPHFALVARGEDGLWRVEFIVNTWALSQQDSSFRFSVDAAHMAFDGERLAYVDGGYGYSTAAVSVWDASGLLYLGQYRHSLGDTYNGYDIPDVRTVYKEPWTVKWTT